MRFLALDTKDLREKYEKHMQSIAEVYPKKLYKIFCETGRSFMCNSKNAGSWSEKNEIFRLRSWKYFRFKGYAPYSNIQKEG